MDRELDEHHDATRQTLHRIANHVLARAQYSVTGQSGLRVTPAGFSTTTVRPDRERLRISGGTLIREAIATSATWTRTIEIDGSTLAELGVFADVDLAGEYRSGTDMPPIGDVREAISLHVASARLIADWYAVVAEALDRLMRSAPTFGAPSLVQLWPEHFDAALDLAFDPESPTERRVNMGGSPGDGFHTAPYLYVGPWTSDRPGDPAFWNAPFGAVVGYDDIASSPDPVEAAHAFLLGGFERLAHDRR